MKLVLGTLVLGAALVPGVAAAAFRIVHFQTPSTNIQCGYVPPGGGFAPELRCEIRSNLKPLPPKPRGCHFDWGAGYSLAPTGPARVLCISDTIQIAKPPVLAYGRTWRGGAFKCLSQAIGLRCSNGSGHGFFLSRERSYVF